MEEEDEGKRGVDGKEAEKEEKEAESKLKEMSRLEHEKRMRMIWESEERAKRESEERDGP